MDALLLARRTQAGGATIGAGRAQVWIGGMKSLLEPLLVLLLAWALGSVIVQLQLSAYVVSSLQGQLQPAYLPTIVFVLSGLVALCTGSSWGTMASAPK